MHARHRPALDDEQKQQHEQTLRRGVDEVPDDGQQLDAGAVEREHEDVRQVGEQADVLETHAHSEQQRQQVALRRERVKLDRHEQRVDDAERRVHLENVVRLERELVFERVCRLEVRVAVHEPDVVGDGGVSGEVRRRPEAGFGVGAVARAADHAQVPETETTVQILCQIISKFRKAKFNASNDM